MRHVFSFGVCIMKNHEVEALKKEIEELKADLADAGRSMSELNAEMCQKKGKLFKTRERLKFVLEYYVKDRKIEIPVTDWQQEYIQEIIDDVL